MTKTLTKQYKNKELSGWHYVKAKDGSINHWLLFTDSIEFDKDGDIKEVLAPVPSYDLWKNIKEQWKVAMPQIERLQEQLKEANEILSIYRCYDDTECGKATEYCKKWGVK